MPRIELRELPRVLAVVLTLGIGAVYYTKALARLDSTADKNSALSFSDREIAGGNSIIVNQEAAYEARVLIPSTETYRVRTGPRLRNATSLTATYVESWYRYFLMPRRPSAQARWIICYGCDLSDLGARYAVRWRDNNGISIGRLR
jgi:hypothetical protein